MQKILNTLVLALLFSNSIWAQLSGTLSVPGTYSSIAAAIADLNTQGVNGATSVQIAANYTETVPVGGFSLTATGTLANPILFQKVGTGANPLLIAYSGGVGTPSSAVQDGMWRLIGSDFITIDGINFQDPNTANPATMEFGIGLFKASATNGCRNNTIQNCVITLNRINNAPGAGPSLAGCKAIELVNAFANSHTVGVTVTAGAGANSNNRFYANTLQNCNIGIALSGANVSATSANIDAGNDIGGSLASNGNTILNFGTGTSSNGNSAYGIRALYQQSLNVGFNAINTSTTSGVLLYGIFLNAAHNLALSNNSVTMSGNYMKGIYIDGASAGNTATLSSNSILNCTSNGGFVGIHCEAITTEQNFNNNRVSGLTNTMNGGFIYGMQIQVGFINTCTLSVASNTVENMNNLNVTAAVYGLFVSGNYQTTFTVQSNVINNISRNTGVSGQMYGLRVECGTSIWFTNSGHVLTNTVTNLVNAGTGPGDYTYGIYYYTGDYTTQYLIANLMSNITGGTSDTYGAFMGQGYGGTVANSNTITNLSSGGHLYGLRSDDHGYNFGVHGNIIGGLMSTGASSVAGLYIDANNFTMSKNRIYNLSSNGPGAAYVNGVDALTIVGSISNNMIGNLSAPNSDYANAVNGMNLINYGNSGAAYILNYNTIRIDAVSSSGLYFGGAAVSAIGAGTLTLRNNILINLLIPNGGSSAVALKRSTTSFSTYTTTSNNNLLYAGTPSSTRLIYSDGTNNMQTLLAFKTLVAPRESASQTENTTFLSTVGTSTNFLHVSAPSIAESGGVNVSGITDDFDGQIRQGNLGYSGTGTAPDIGADEFGTPLCSTVSASTLSPASMSICAGQTVSLTRTTTQTAVFPGTQQQWQRSLNSGGPYTLVAVSNATNMSYTTPTLSPGMYYYTFASTCSVSTLTAVSNEVTVSVSPYPQPTVSPATPVICTGAASSVILTASGASQFSWSPGNNLSNSNGSTVIANPASSETYTITGINPGGCTGSTTITVNVYPSPTVSVAGNTIVCAGGNVNLTASGANSYTWNTAATQATISPQVYALTVYSVIGTSSLGNCTSLALFTVNVNPTPTLSATGGTVLCAGQSATLSASGADTYLWSNSATTSSIIVSPPSTVSYSVAGTFTNTGCFSVSQLIVTVVALPTISISGPNAICSGEPLNLNASGATNYTWSTGSTATGITVNPTSNTTYSVLGVSGPGCSATAIKAITVHPIPTASITSASTIICEGETLELTASSDIANQFFWSTGSTAAVIAVAPTSNTSYGVTVKNSITNCTNVAQFSVAVDPCTGLGKMPQQDRLVLQPNPFHSHFSIEWYGTEETNLEIYDVTGRLILLAKIQNGHNEIDMARFAKGLYYVKVNSLIHKLVQE